MEVIWLHAATNGWLMILFDYGSLKTKIVFGYAGVVERVCWGQRVCLRE